MRKTKIEKKLKRKTNEELVRTIIKAKKNEKWLEVSSALSIPKRKAISANLNEIENEAVHGETIVVPGKVLGKGDLSKKIKISAFSFSNYSAGAGKDFQRRSVFLRQRHPRPGEGSASFLSRHAGCGKNKKSRRRDNINFRRNRKKSAR